MAGVSETAPGPSGGAASATRIFGWFMLAMMAAFLANTVLTFWVGLRGYPGADTRQALERFGLSHLAEVPGRMLSAGQKRRLALARLLVAESKLWILDEPFTSLDKKSMASFENMFEQHLLQQGMIVMTSHHDIEMSDSNLQRLDLSA